MSAIDKKRWMFVDVSSVDLTKLSTGELISLKEFTTARMNKHAAHLIRILKMGIEFLVDGRLQVLRKDAQYLLGIKRGEWTLEQVKNEAERLFAVAETTFASSKLPAMPDKEKINKLCVNMGEIQLYHKYKAK